MSTGANQQRLTPDERANLVAFIDGELPDLEARALSAKLNRSPTARLEVEMLKKTWELLEHLPRPAITEQFSERTLSQIRQRELQGGQWNATLQSWSGLVARIAVILLIAALSLSTGYVLTRWIWPNPTARLVRDLTLAENLEGYLEIGSYDFLEELARSSEFGSGSH